MKTRGIKKWQWPNLLALDASLIAVCWLWVFLNEQAAGLNLSAYAVIGISVWLTYIADRVFDVHGRADSELLSKRHQFTKDHRRLLCCIWTALLVVNLGTALTCLSPTQIFHGWVLLGLCLSYTGLNQLLSKHFFPKELLVALIFTGGTQIFLPHFSDGVTLLSFGLLCLINCLVIGWKERPVDKRLGLRSLSSVLQPFYLVPLFSIGLVASTFSSCPLALTCSFLLLACAHWTSRHIDRELFRVLSDGALLLGPLVYFVQKVVL
jgi:hypothetical protein